jgi:methionyl-tRNA formyltransferase
MANDTQQLHYAFFGTPEFAVIVLDELEAAGYSPALIVTAPDKPQGRKLVVTPSPVKAWAMERRVPVLTPLKLNDEHFAAELSAAHCNLFIVAAYGKIIPKLILDMPKHGTINVHPSLLPKFRGPSPIESAILSNEDHTGVTIIGLDEETDHGPVIAQKECSTPDWPPKGSVLTWTLAHEGGRLLADVLPQWLATHEARPQKHTQATFTKKIRKEDGLIDLAGDALINYKKIRAFDEWPGAYFFMERNGKQVRIRVTDAAYTDGALTITRIIPEGKKEMSYEDFLRGSNN